MSSLKLSPNYFRRALSCNLLLRSLGTTPILKKALGVKKAILGATLGANSRNSGVFSEQLSEWHSQPNLCENPILGATLGATLGIGWTPKFQPEFSERFFFSKLGKGKNLRKSARICESLRLGSVCPLRFVPLSVP